MKRLFLLIAVALVATTNICSAQKLKDIEFIIHRYTTLVQEEEKYEEAEMLVDSMLARYPGNSDMMHLKAISLFNREEEAQCLECYTTALKNVTKKSYFDRPFLLYTRAALHLNLGDIDSAMVDIEDGLKVVTKRDYNTMYKLLLLRAECNYLKAEYELAYRDIVNVIMEDDNPAHAYYALCLMCKVSIDTHDYDKAIFAATELLLLDEPCHDAFHTLAQAYYATGDNHLAIDSAKWLIVFDVGDATRSELKDIFMSDREYAKQLVDEMVAEDTEHEYNLECLAMYDLCNDYDSMIKLLEYDDLEPEEKLYQYAALSAEAGKYEDAVAYITEYMATIPEEYYQDKAYVLSLRHEYYRDMGDYENAINDAQSVISLLPEYAFGYYAKGWCYELLKNDEVAMECYNEGISVDQSYAYIYLMRGEQYLKHGDKERAKQDFEHILEIDNEPKAGSARQYALHFLGRDAEAMDWMNQMIHRYPYHSGIYYDAACLYARMGEIYQSIDCLNRALSLGYKAKSHIENDDDLDPIRDNDIFKSLMKQYFE